MKAPSDMARRLFVLTVIMAACVGGKTKPPNRIDSPIPEFPSRSRADGATCYFDEDCKSGSCAGPGCVVGMPGRCVNSARGGCRNVSQFCSCDGFTGTIEPSLINRKRKKRCPWSRYEHLGACKVEAPPPPNAGEDGWCKSIVNGRFAMVPCPPFLEPPTRDTGEVWTHEGPPPAQPGPQP